MGVSHQYISCTPFFFFLRFFIYLFMTDTHRDRNRDIGRGRSKLHAGNLMWDSIPGLQDHSLGRNAGAKPWATQGSPALIFNNLFLLFPAILSTELELNTLFTDFHLVSMCLLVSSGPFKRWSLILLGRKLGYVFLNTIILLLNISLWCCEFSSFSFFTLLLVGG